GAVGVHLAGEQSTRQRHTDNHPYLTPFCLLKEKLRWTLPKDIENNLDGLHIWVFNGLQRFLYLLHAHPVITDFSCHYEVIQNPKNLWTVINFRWGAVKLHKVDAVCPQIL